MGRGKAFGKHNLEKSDSRSTEASPEGIGGRGNASQNNCNTLRIKDGDYNNFRVG